MTGMAVAGSGGIVWTPPEDSTADNARHATQHTTAQSATQRTTALRTTALGATERGTTKQWATRVATARRRRPWLPFQPHRVPTSHRPRHGTGRSHPPDGHRPDARHRAGHASRQRHRDLPSGSRPPNPNPSARRRSVPRRNLRSRRPRTSGIPLLRHVGCGPTSGAGT